MKTKFFSGLCACLLLMCGVLGVASASSLGDYTAEGFLPALNEALAATPLAEQVDTSDPFEGEDGMLGYYVCENTYLMLTPARNDKLSRVTLTLLTVEDVDKAEQLLHSTIQATVPGGLSDNALGSIVEALDMYGLLADEGPHALTRYQWGETTYTLETLTQGLLLCVEN